MARHSKPGTVPPVPTRAKDFGELRRLREVLEAQAERLRREQAQAQRRRAQAATDSELFRRSIGAVRPLRDTGQVRVAPPPPAPIPRQTRLDEQQVLREALSDAYDPDMLLDSDDSISFRRPGVGLEVVRKLRRGTWVVQAQLDLHGMRREEAREALSAFVQEASKSHLRCLRVIHGKGLGSVNREPVLKGKVRSWLSQKSEVLAFAETQERDGGAGAVLVLLQPRRH